MTLTKDESDKNFYHSDSLDTDALKNDIEDLFKIIVDHSYFSSQQILIFVDGTNGNINFSPYDHNKRETLDGDTVWLFVEELWNDNNSYDFDEITTSAIKLALNTITGQKMGQKHDLYMQTELDQPQKL